jgi:hypothetical protein
MASRQIEDIKYSIKDFRITTLRFTVTGGDSGKHFVQFLQGDWHCDCFGFTSHGKCRHKYMGMVMYQKLMEALIHIQRIEDQDGWKEWSSQI